jgi:hypothetical protein
MGRSGRIQPVKEEIAARARNPSNRTKATDQNGIPKSSERQARQIISDLSTNVKLCTFEAGQLAAQFAIQEPPFAAEIMPDPRKSNENVLPLWTVL